MKPEPYLYCCHGFLGSPADWDAVVPEEIPRVNFDLFRYCAPELGSDLPTVASRLNREVSAARGTCDQRVLLGYSLGGRVALHMLLDRPDLWNRAIIVSAHPGLEYPEDRQRRLCEDSEWARRFEIEPWDELMDQWNRLPVFGTKSAPARAEREFSREALAYALRTWSLGQQQNLRPLLSGLDLPVLWIAGTGDGKYCELARETSQLNLRFDYAEIDGAAHRVPWERPGEFRQVITDFLNR